MQIVIFHYHLNPGGVTRIIESQVAGFKKVYPDASIKILTGYCENHSYYNDFDVDVIVDPLLNYLDQKPYAKAELDSLLQAIEKTFKVEITKQTIVHAHNLNLGKNPLVTLAVNQLLKNGNLIINHAHDFSEDRPNNQAFLHHIIEDVYQKDLSNIMYPSSKHYKVGVLNRFDYERVLDIGVNQDSTYLWPNPVYVPLGEQPNKKENRKVLNKLFQIPESKIIITYPVRVIQRKNIGELVLLAALYTHCQFMVTLPPRNPVEIVSYDKWKNFCKENAIDLIFEAGEKAGFTEIISGSDFCITTSIKEGFGMAYLEPWLMGTPVVGRDIPYVTSDLKEEGVTFPFLYEALIVSNQCQNVDFKSLSLEEQVSIIRAIKQKEISLDQIETLNPTFKNFPQEVSSSLIQDNQDKILKNFSIEEYAKRIYRAYSSLS